MNEQIHTAELELGAEFNFGGINGTDYVLWAVELAHKDMDSRRYLLHLREKK